MFAQCCCGRERRIAEPVLRLLVARLVEKGGWEASRGKRHPATQDEDWEERDGQGRMGEAEEDTMIESRGFAVVYGHKVRKNGLILQRNFNFLYLHLQYPRSIG